MCYRENAIRLSAITTFFLAVAKSNYQKNREFRCNLSAEGWSLTQNSLQKYKIKIENYIPKNA